MGEQGRGASCGSGLGSSKVGCLRAGDCAGVWAPCIYQ